MKKNVLIKQKGGSGNYIVHIENEFNIYNVAEIKSEIESLIKKKAKRIDLELSKITSFDLSAIQLLYSLKKVNNLDVNFKIELPDEIKNIIINSGFEQLTN